MNDGFANNLATVIFFGSLVPAWFAWRKTRLLGTALPSFNRAMQRLAFSASVFLGCFGSLFYFLWLIGAFFELGQVFHRNVAYLAWVSLGLLLWAGLTYRMLKWKTLGGNHGHEEPS